MNVNLANSLALAAPEMVLLLLTSVVLLVDLFLTDRQRQLTYLLSIATLLATAVMVAGLRWSVSAPSAMTPAISTALSTALRIAARSSGSIGPVTAGPVRTAFRRARRATPTCWRGRSTSWTPPVPSLSAIRSAERRR